jgi:tellurite resistance protein TehA-like permease
VVANRLRSLARRPDAFAFVMATGILSVAASEEGVPGVSTGLLGTAAAALVLLTAGKARSFALDARAEPVALLTFVAGTAIVGARLAGSGLWRWPALPLFGLAVGSWLWLLPRVWSRIRAASVPEARGAWLLGTVAPESLAMLAANLAPLAAGLRDAAVALWAFGAVAYVPLAGLLALRLARAGLAPAQLTPDWWIVSGAASIVSVAAHALAAGGSPPLQAASVVGWGLASAAIPPLVAAESRRALATGVVLGDLPARYSMVFPLGMYATATYGVARQLGSAGLVVAGHAAFAAACAAWVVVTACLVRPHRPADSPVLHG